MNNQPPQITPPVATQPPSQKGSLKGFGLNIQAKHPEYNDMSAEETATKVLQKYPQYQDMVDPTKKPSFLEDEHDSFKRLQNTATGGDLNTGAKQDFASPAIGLGHASDLLVRNPVKHAAGAINQGLLKLPGVKGIEDKITQGAGAVANSSVGQAVGGAYQDFKTAHPRLAGAGEGILKGIDAGLDVTAGIQGFNSIKNLIHKPPTMESALIASGATTDVEAPKIVQTLKDIGVTSLDKHSLSVANNILTNTLENVVQTGSQSTVQSIANALKVIQQFSSVPAEAVAPGLLSRLASSAGKAISYPVRHPFGTAGAGLLANEAYQRLGGQNLAGTQ